MIGCRSLQKRNTKIRRVRRRSDGRSDELIEMNYEFFISSGIV